LNLLIGANSQLLGQAANVVSKFGQAQVGGRDVVVHVTVVVPPGVNPNQAALDALRDQGARPFQADEFSTTGLVWDQFSDAGAGNDYVVQNYNPAGDPTGSGSTALLNTQDTWNDVSTSKFVFDDGGETNRCPSLVKECKGPQTFDGFNDVGWLRIGGCCTLAVTWFSTSVDEADMAMNTNFSWSPQNGGFDAETVMLHENGHALGLGHSEVLDAVMYATYQGVHPWLHSDDIDGITFLYPLDGSTGSISGTVTSSSDGSAISGTTVEVENTSLSATTDTNGDYTIGQIPEGNYDVTASASDFISETASNVGVSANTDTSGTNFTLDPDGTSGGTTLVISNVSSQKSGRGGNFKITWNTNNSADSEVTFTCCGTFNNSELVTDHSMSFRGQKNATYEYWVTSTDAAGSSVTEGPYNHEN
jgi:hypothetical protein